MDSSAAGLAALALFVLVLGYWVPQRVRHRQQLLDSRIDDRFSGGLRVLAVAADGGFRTSAAGQEAPLGLLRAATGPAVPDRAAAGRPPSGATPSREPRPITVPARTEASRRGERPMEQKAAAVRTSRLALLELRARRARRRLALTVVLLVATASVWAAVPLTPLLWYAGLAPTALLLLVLVLGRAAARQARRTDARWEAERRAAQRRALQARALANGGPHAPRNRARVTGRAVHGSSTMTQMIPRVPVTVIEGEAEEVEPATRSRGAVRAPMPAPDDEAVRPVAAPAPAPAAAAVDEAAGSAWEPRPVPLPTYVTKPAAPRREPRPITGATAAVSTGWSSSPWQRVEDRGEEVGEATTSWSLGATQDAALGPTATPAPVVRGGGGAPVTASAGGGATAGGGAAGPADGDPTVAEEPRTRSETLGLPLEQILARRRAAG